MKPKIERIKEEIIFLTHQKHRIAMKVSLELLEKEYKAQHEKELKRVIGHGKRSIIEVGEEGKRIIEKFKEENQKLKTKILGLEGENKELINHNNQLLMDNQSLKKELKDEIEVGYHFENDIKIIQKELEEQKKVFDRSVEQLQLSLENEKNLHKELEDLKDKQQELLMAKIGFEKGYELEQKNLKIYKAKVLEGLDIIIKSIDNDCLKLNSANDYEEGIRLNLQGVKMQLEEFKQKLKEEK